MRRGLAIAFAASCSFSPAAANQDGGDIVDAADSADATLPNQVACTVRAVGAESVTPAVGNSNADATMMDPALACAPDEMLIGIAVWVTPSSPPGGWNERVVK